MITILAFARYRELLGFDRLEMAPAPTLDALLSNTCFAKLPKDALLAVNQEFADRSAALKNGDEIALLPPVSGG